MLKAKPNLESRIRTLKRDWTIVYDMLSEKTIAALVGTIIGSLLVIKKPVNSNIVVSLIMTNLLPSMQKIELVGKMLKQQLILLKK
ncbi:hypothetical protein Goshw_009540 [Gossypium schwendimanii]|uniref:Uncharacterized protein n=2 Tax=Gossypium schwendimanii TaxID=34291 RepID=A0A7J9MGY0_GOSSC|nr:hypothetical protein [Gossypium schwendimanii]